MAGKFVISPEPFVKKCRSLAKGKDLRVDVENEQIRLAWSTQSGDGKPDQIEYIDRIEASRLDIDYDLLLDAVLKYSGATIMDGRYPVTDEIIRCLREVGLRS